MQNEHQLLDELFSSAPEEDETQNPQSVRDTRRASDSSREASVAAQPKNDSSLMDELFEIQQVMSPGEAAFEGVKSGAVTGGGALAGGMAGARLGAAAGPWGAGAGFVAGTIAGGMGADYLGKQTGVTTSYEDIPEDVQPLYNAGETFMETAMLMNVPYTLKTGLFGKGRVGGFIDDIITYATTNRKKFLAMETIGAAGAAGGAFTAETIDPGAEGTRLGLEVLGGGAASITPSKLILNGAISLKNKLTAPLNRFTETGQQDQAVTIIKNLMDQFGEDPEKLIEMIDKGALEIDGVPIRLGTAQQTGSTSLAVLTAFLAKRDSELATSLGEMGNKGVRAMSDLIGALESTGDPALIKEAAGLKADLFTRTIEAGRREAESKIAETAARITVERGTSREALSSEAFDIIDSSLKEVRTIERNLYEAVPVMEVSQIPNLRDVFSQESSRLLLEENMPSLVSRFVTRASDTSDPTNTKELMRFRSIMLDSAREAEIAGKSQDARMYGQLADAALADLDGAFGTGNNAYNDARAFTKELHDKYTRSFVGKTLASGRFGEKIAPELVLKRAIASGREVGALQARELDEAVQFAIERAGVDPSAAEDMFELQERYIRSMAAEMFNMDGKLKSPEQLNKFMQNNQDLLDKFPTLRQQFKDAIDGKIEYDEVTRSLTGKERYAEDTALFAKLSGTKNEDPIRVVKDILGGRTTYADLDELLDIVTADASDLGRAKESVKTVLWEAIRTRNLSADGKLKVANMMSDLFDPPSKGQPSLADYMLSKGVISKEQLDSSKVLFEKMTEIQTSMATTSAIKNLDGNLSFLTDLVVRIGSAKVGTALSSTAGSDANSLIVAAASVRAGQTIFNKMPAGKLEGVLRKAMSDPAFAKMLIEKAPDKITYMENLRQIHAYMLNAGLLGGAEVTNQEFLQNPEQGEQQ